MSAPTAISLAEVARRQEEQHVRLKKFHQRLRELEKLMQVIPNPEEGRDDE